MELHAPTDRLLRRYGFWTLIFVLTVLLEELTFRGLGMKKGRKPGMNSPKNDMTKATRSSAEHIASNTTIWNQRSRAGSNFHRKIAKLTKAPL